VELSLRNKKIKKFIEIFLSNRVPSSLFFNFFQMCRNFFNLLLMKIAIGRKNWMNCKKCPLYAHRQVIMGRGSTNPKIIFIGEAPGEEEEKKGQPFVGRAGKQLNKAINFLGIDKKDYFITNLVKCRPVTPDGKNRPPTDREKSLCGRLLQKQIRRMKPSLLITLGNHATQYFLGGNINITKISGKSIRMGWLYIFPLLHPASFLHQPKFKSKWFADIRSLKKFILQKGILSLKHPQSSLDNWMRIDKEDA